MGDTVISLKCPNCGASVARDASKCEYCGSPLIIKSYADIKPLSLPERNKYLAFFVGRMQSDGAVSSSLSTAICMMSLGVYDKARSVLEKVVESGVLDADCYFYLAVSLLGGKKAFLLTRKGAEQVENYVNAAIGIEDKALYYLFYAYLSYDFFERKGLNCRYGYRELAGIAAQKGLGETEKACIFELMRVKNPLEGLI